MADSMLSPFLVAIPKRHGDDDHSLPLDFQHPAHHHRRKIPLCPEEVSTPQEHVDQIDAKGNVQLCRTFIQDDHKNESLPQVPSTRSSKHGTSMSQAQESPAGSLILLLHSRRDYYLGKRYFQNAARMTVRL